MKTGKQSQVTVAKNIDNPDSVNVLSVLISGYYLDGVRTLYVEELLNVLPNQVVTNDYSTNFDGFEFVFSTADLAAAEAQISVWGKNLEGVLIAAHRLVSNELLGGSMSVTGATGATGGTGVTGATGSASPTSVNLIYVVNNLSDNVSVIYGKTNAIVATVTVGSGPYGVGVNP